MRLRRRLTSPQIGKFNGPEPPILIFADHEYLIAYAPEENLYGCGSDARTAQLPRDGGHSQRQRMIPDSAPFENVSHRRPGRIY